MTIRLPEYATALLAGGGMRNRGMPVNWKAVTVTVLNQTPGRTSQPCISHRTALSPAGHDVV